ncbi:MAG TPA: lipoate--protein ligase family protein [Anaerolineales bacterium]|nr:lipoate--protein ligase family protein [Anaerolineales bacterium]
MSSIWRLVYSSPASGRENMAADEALLEAVTQRVAAPTLRFYAWDPPCLSLGRAQPLAQVDLVRLEAEGWDWVRRPTGGRAILHTDELTYAVAGPIDEPDLAGGVLDSYRRLSAGLVRGLELLGIQPDPPAETHVDDAGRQQPVCFEVPSAYEITVGGRKLIGSAQVRRRGGVLQHGTLPLGGDLTRICRVLRYPDELARRAAADRLSAHAVTLEELLGRRVGWQEAATALAKGFDEALGWPLESTTTSETESVSTRSGEGLPASVRQVGG